MKSRLLFLILFKCSICFSQDTPDRIIEDKYIQQEEVSYDQIYEMMIQYSNDPLELNTVTQEELESLGILDPFQIQSLLEYRIKTGGFISLYELQVINGFDITTIQSILPFITIKKNTYEESLLKRILHNPTNYLISQTSLSKTLDSINYTGNKNPIYIRYRNYKVKDFSLGLSLKNDAGEPIQWNTQKNYYLCDFTSFHFSIYNKGIIKAMTIGDYKVQFGQGLITGGGFNIGKGGETILSTKQNNSGILSNTSSTEYFKGVAITIPIEAIECTSFMSRRKIDGSIDSINNSFSKVTSTYHRTNSELNKRRNINETNLGFNLQYTSKDRRFHIGITNLTTWYSKEAKPSPQLYSLYQFNGKTNSVIGSNFNYLYRNVNLFGETALSKSGGTATVVGLLVSLSRFVDAAILFRNYDKNFQSFYSNAFSEGTSASNERGIYTGFKFKPVSKIEVACYYDQFVFPWLKYQTYATSRGYEYLVRVQYTPSRKSSLSFQMKQENKEVNSDDIILPYYNLIERQKRNYQLSYKTQLPNLKMGSRVQFSTIKQNSIATKGYVIIQDIEYIHRKFLIACRYALFATDDYDNRQYAYERNFIYNFSIASYYGKGTRCYFMLRYKLTNHFDIWLRYTQTSSEEDKTNNRSITGMIQIKL